MAELEKQPETPEGHWSPPHSGAWWMDLRAWVRDVVISVVIAAIVIVFLYQPVKVEGTSMMPWLTDQERIFVNKFVYRFGEIHRGDIVVFWFPLDPTKSYIKRVIGLPGDTVEIDQGTVLVNGQVVEENYVPEQYRDRMSYPPVKVEPDHYYVLGDHRNASNDSRTWRTVERKLIYGKAVFVYWPLEKFGVLH
ncbi:MAG: signal peptidase I [Acidobacteria bacterium]|nr:signal peptidase I [Acidobacteriota bacterium]